MPLLVAIMACTHRPPENLPACDGPCLPDPEKPIFQARRGTTWEDSGEGASVTIPIVNPNGFQIDGTACQLEQGASTIDHESPFVACRWRPPREWPTELLARWDPLVPLHVPAHGAAAI